MKYTIIVGFFATIIAISAMPNGKSNDKCINYPKKWDDALEKCYKKASIDTRVSFMSYNKTTATRDAKCLALCYYLESGEFTDGKFDPIAIGNYLRAYIGSHNLLEALIKIHVNSANAANAEKGDDCDRAYAYHASNTTPEEDLVFEMIFCSSKNENQN